MSSTPRAHGCGRRAVLAALTAGLALAAGLPGAIASEPPPSPDARPADQPTIAEQLAADGVQQVAKHEPTPAVIAGTDQPIGVNPYLSNEAHDKADYHYWDTLVAARADQRAAAAIATLAAPPSVVDELEPEDLVGRNDTLEGAELIKPGATPSDVRILGTLARAPIAAAVPIGPFAEDDGAIPLANPTGLSAAAPAVRAAGVIGDGPHGLADGDGTGDFDVFAIEDAVAGQVLTVDVDAAIPLGSKLDSLVVLLAADGTPIAANDDAPSFDSFLQVAIPADGDYYLGIVAFGSVPANPFDSGSGSGARSEGPYEVELRFDFAEDLDVFGFDLDAGDVIGATVSGAGSVLGVFDPSGVPVSGSGLDVSGSYPFDSGLPGGGNATVDHVAAVSGRHYLMVSRGLGDYDVRLRRLRPGLESGTPGERQILFLDFDGAELNTRIFGGPGVRTLSPLAAFLGGWGLGSDDENAVIDSIIATFEENLVHDPQALGVNPNFAVDIRNSRDHADPWGQPNVSRIIIGGTRAEMGRPDVTFVGISESADPGNLDQTETALLLLDQASAPAGSGLRTINDFVSPGVDMVGLVGHALGFVASHEAGHYLGNWHTAPNNGVTSIMDTFDLTQLGLGPDFVFGTADDVDVDFVTDTLIEGMTGSSDTLSRVAWGLSAAPAPLEVPGAPGPVTALKFQRSALVMWSAPETGGDVTGYVVRAVRNGKVKATTTIGAELLHAVVTGLAPGTYTFTVAATNAAGEGPATASAPVRIKA